MRIRKEILHYTSVTCVPSDFYYCFKENDIFELKEKALILWKTLPSPISLSAVLVGALALWNTSSGLLTGMATGGLSADSHRTVCLQSCVML